MRSAATLAVVLGGCTLPLTGLPQADAGVLRDAGRPDGAVVETRDAAPRDGGGPMDAAGDDAGAVDAGFDAGAIDAGVDAGPGCVAGDEICDARDNDCDGVADEGDVCGCPAVANAGSLYLFCAARMSWDNARSYCQARGYDLAVLRSMVEETWVWDRTRTLTGDTDTWMGLGDRAVEGEYTWLDGTVVWRAGAPVTGVRNNWRGGAPAEQEAEDCVELDDGGGQWADEVCSAAAPFVCEAPLP